MISSSPGRCGWNDAAPWPWQPCSTALARLEQVWRSSGELLCFSLCRAVHVEEGRSFIAVCGLVWLHQCGCWGKRISLSTGHKYTDLTEGLWAPGVCIFETKSCPAGPGVFLFLENSDKEVVLGLAKSSIRDFLQVFCLAVHRLPGSP